MIFIHINKSNDIGFIKISFEKQLVISTYMKYIPFYWIDIILQKFYSLFLQAFRYCDTKDKKYFIANNESSAQRLKSMKITQSL